MWWQHIMNTYSWVDISAHWMLYVESIRWCVCTWRCHDMKTLSALQTLCEVNPPVVYSPHKGSVMQSLMFSLLIVSTICRKISQVVVDLRCHSGPVTSVWCWHWLIWCCMLKVSCDACPPWRFWHKHHIAPITEVTHLFISSSTLLCLDWSMWHWHCKRLISWAFSFIKAS